MVMDSAKNKNAWVVRVLSTLGGWLVAFLIVFLMLTFYGEKLESLPHALSALIFTGILVPIMGNVVMPRVTAIVKHYLRVRR